MLNRSTISDGRVLIVISMLIGQASSNAIAGMTISLRSGNQVVAQYRADGQRLRIVPLNGGLVEERSNGGAVEARLVVRDHLRSSAAVVSLDGTVVESMLRWPMGSLMLDSMNSVQPTWSGFLGQHLDSESQLHHLGARCYDSVVGRFMAIDPLAERFPSLSPYEYARSNALRFADPDGRAPVDVNAIVEEVNQKISDMTPAEIKRRAQAIIDAYQNGAYKGLRIDAILGDSLKASDLMGNKFGAITSNVDFFKFKKFDVSVERIAGFRSSLMDWRILIEDALNSGMTLDDIGAGVKNFHDHLIHTPSQVKPFLGSRGTSLGVASAAVLTSSKRASAATVARAGLRATGLGAVVGDMIFPSAIAENPLQGWIEYEAFIDSLQDPVLLFELTGSMRLDFGTTESQP